VSLSRHAAPFIYGCKCARPQGCLSRNLVISVIYAATFNAQAKPGD